MYGGWHWFLFDSYYSDVMKKKKFHPKVQYGFNSPSIPETTL